MWRTAGRAIAAHPLAGIGIGEFSGYVDAEIAAGRSNPSIGRYNQPHNEYLEAAATGGVPGLLVLLATFRCRCAISAVTCWIVDEAVAMPACAGLAVVTVYAVCAHRQRVLPGDDAIVLLFHHAGHGLLIARQRSAPGAVDCGRVRADPRCRSWCDRTSEPERGCGSPMSFRRPMLARWTRQRRGSAQNGEAAAAGVSAAHVPRPDLAPTSAATRNAPAGAVPPSYADPAEPRKIGQMLAHAPFTAHQLPLPVSCRMWSLGLSRTTCLRVG